MRAANRHRVLDVLRDEAGVFTQAELARATGLAPATVSSLVRELVGGAAWSSPSRAAAGAGPPYGSRPRAGIVAGIDFGHSHLAVAVGDLSGRMVAE